MAAVYDEKNKKEGKGFAGISSLVTDIDKLLPPTARRETPVEISAAKAEPERQNVQSNSKPEEPKNERQPYQDPPKKSSELSGGMTVFAVAVVLGLLCFLAEIGNRSSEQTSNQVPAPASSLPAPKNAPSYSSASQQSPVSSRPEESKPPVEHNLVYSTAQIMYCLAEEIRIDGAEEVINRYRDAEVNQFNAMVADYNSRCGSFRYRSGTLESAQRQIQPYRSQLLSEGKNRFTHGAAIDKTSAKLALNKNSLSGRRSSSPDATVQAIQRKLNELGYNAGRADGLMGKGTRSAIVAFQRDNGLVATGMTDQTLLSFLQQAQPRKAKQSRSTDSLAQLSTEEASSLEAVCSSEKYLNGPSAYSACIARHKASLARGPRRPNLSALSAEEQQSAEAACSTDKYLNGPAAYNKCLKNQLAALSGVRNSRPNMSRLSPAEKESIEAACSQDKYLNGPAAYNRCLNNQLTALERQGPRPDLSMLGFNERNSIESACSQDKYLNGPAAYNRCLSRHLSRLRK